jgi:hypothetical protein
MVKIIWSKSGLPTFKLNRPKSLGLDYADAIKAIFDLKDKFGGSSLFGNEKDQSFKSIIATIYQTFGGIDLYPSVEEKAVNLLYFVVKNHSFSDGINVSLPIFSCGFWIGTKFFIEMTVPNELPIMHFLH